VRELNRDSHPNEFDAYNINTSKKDTAKQSKAKGFFQMKTNQI
jgi:hypothetical protein